MRPLYRYFPRENSFMSALKTINGGIRGTLDKVVLVEKYICSVVLVIMTAITFAQVVCRFVFHNPFSWSEEVTLMLLVWFGYLCMPIDIYTDEHAAIFAFYNKMPAAVKKGLDFLRHGLLLWFFIILTKYGVVLSKLNLRKIQPATGISYVWRYIPLIVGGILMSIYCISNLIKTFATPVSEYKVDLSDMSFEEQVKQKVQEKGGTL